MSSTDNLPTPAAWCRRPIYAFGFGAKAAANMQAGGKSHSTRNGGPLDIAPDGPRKGDASPRLPHGNCKSAGSTLRRAAKAVIESYRQPSRQRAGSRGWTMATIEIENRRSKAGGHDLLLPSRPRSRMNVPRQVRSAAGRA
jgi:hypothetical protein